MAAVKITIVQEGVLQQSALQENPRDIRRGDFL
jgi:hypothetical protein